MNEWEAKYKALAAGIDDPKLIENAEKLVSITTRITLHSALPFSIVFQAMLQAIHTLRDKPKVLKKLLGFPVESADWMPANKAMIFGSFGAVITDLQTGESKVASKEDLEKALRNITKNV